MNWRGDRATLRQGRNKEREGKVNQMYRCGGFSDRF